MLQSAVPWPNTNPSIGHPRKWIFPRIRRRVSTITGVGHSINGGKKQELKSADSVNTQLTTSSCLRQHYTDLQASHEVTKICACTVML